MHCIVNLACELVQVISSGHRVTHASACICVFRPKKSYNSNRNSKGLPRGAVVPGFPGSPGVENQIMDNFLAKRHTGESASGIRRLDESPVRRFAGIAGPLDNDIQPVPLTRERVPPATREPSVDTCPPANPTYICDPLSCNP